LALLEAELEVVHKIVKVFLRICESISPKWLFSNLEKFQLHHRNVSNGEKLSNFNGRGQTLPHKCQIHLCFEKNSNKDGNR